MKHSISRNFPARIVAALAVLALGVCLAAPAFALSDAEYKKMMKDPTFAAADKALNAAWKEAKKSLPFYEFDALKRDQKQWVEFDVSMDDELAWISFVQADVQLTPRVEKLIDSYLKY